MQQVKVILFVRMQQDDVLESSCFADMPAYISMVAAPLWGRHAVGPCALRCILLL